MSNATRACPKCGHIRRAGNSEPAWQCPSCGIAYHKYAAHLERLKASVAPRQTELPSMLADSSVWSLVGVNVVALVVALAQGWQLADLMAVYWVQSIIIGLSYFARILQLDKFSTENFKINNQAVEPTVATKTKTAMFFLVHFGGFHLAYLMFIALETPSGFRIDPGLVVCTLAFAANHFFSYRYHRALDRRGTPNIGRLMFTPYLRIVPMHLTIVFGAIALSLVGVLFFGILKTVADVVMHQVEHRRLGENEPQVNVLSATAID